MGQVNQTRFLKEFEEWMSEIWIAVHFLRNDSEVLFDDFLETGLALRRIYLRDTVFKKKWSSESIPVFFMGLWRQRLRSLAKRDGWGLDSGPEENEFIGNLILFCLVKKKMNFSEAARWVGVSNETLKRRAFQKLLEFAKLSPKETHVESRECVKNDLYRMDVEFSSDWKDPLKVYTKQDHTKHAMTCHRCQRVNEHIRGAINEIQNLKSAVMPLNSRETIESELSSSFKIFSLDSLALWPWYLKTPVQMAFMGLLIFTLLSVPFIGDLFPGLVPSQKTISRVADKTWVSISGFWKQTLDQVQSSKVPELEKFKEPPVSSVVAVESQAIVTSQSTQEFFPDVPMPLRPSIVRNPPKVETAARPPQIPENDQDLKNARIFFRWGAFSGDLVTQTQLILEILQKYGATKAGDLELGAAYKGGSYFHFSVKEESLPALVADIRKIGLVDFTQSSAKSDRITESGMKRVVFLLAPSRNIF